MLGASSELLVSQVGREVVSHPLAGSAARTPDPMKDRRRAAALHPTPAACGTPVGAARSRAHGRGSVMRAGPLSPLAAGRPQPATAGSVHDHPRPPPARRTGDT
ncbi:chorismate-binding protein [Actinomadura graeca]|uniref:Chorismate-binding protein n=1 Tax=Actinomadura graeca TaxID=2750812 RepID=A0ABX8QN26_9ACTN|nr:chorismate-binding protein [Actinomadura graeca]QXJ20170.1 chorismate-binding protein [Actinomadura graeca]